MKTKKYHKYIKLIIKQIHNEVRKYFDAQELESHIHKKKRKKNMRNSFAICIKQILITKIKNIGILNKQKK